MCNTTGEHQVDWGCEVIAVLQEEGTFLGKEHFEALIDRDLRLVGLDLAEVRINGSIQHEAVVQDELGVEADIRFQPAPFKKRVIGIALVDIAKPSQKGVRNELHIPAG